MNVAATTIPIIDISPFVNIDSTEEQKNDVVKQVWEACEQIGFFFITGHGVQTEIIDRAYSIAKEFFDLPSDEKDLVKGDGAGYLAMEKENLAATLNITAHPDLKETFNISSRSEQNKWPESPPEFQRDSIAYFNEMAKLASIIMEIFALALKLPQNYFQEYTIPPNAVLRFADYPALLEPPKPDQWRAGEHTDYGTLTIVRSTSSGLQACDRNGTWVEVNPPPDSDSFVVNIGDAMERWTNDKWRSTLHRVANPVDGYGTRRQAIVFFHNPRDDVEISCLKTCYNDDYPQRYPPINAGEHRKSKSKKSRPTM